MNLKIAPAKEIYRELGGYKVNGDEITSATPLIKLLRRI